MTPAEIKEMRMSAGITQREAAEMTGVAIRTWQHWEFGDRKIPKSSEWLFKLLLENRNG